MPRNYWNYAIKWAVAILRIAVPVGSLITPEQAVTGKNPMCHHLCRSICWNLSQDEERAPNSTRPERTSMQRMDDFTKDAYIVVDCNCKSCKTL